MNAKTTINWQQANQHYLMAAVKVVQEELKLYLASVDNQSEKDNTKQPELSSAKQELKKAADNLTGQAALDTLTTLFGLSTFEQKVLLMCGGMELDSNFPTLLGPNSGGFNSFIPSFGIALAAFPDAHWSALSPNSSLRYWRLVEVNKNQLLTKSPLRIDEQILLYLTGIHRLDERLQGVVVPFFDESELVASHNEMVDNI